MKTKTLTKFKSQVLTLMLTIVALAVGQSAWAQDVTGTGAENDPYVVYSWTQLKDKMAAGGYIRLDGNVSDPTKSTSSYLSVPSGKTVMLDLNGHTIDRGLTSATDNGYVINVAGTLTINDSSNPSTGTITGGNNIGMGGGVYVASSGMFTMTSGTISGNTAITSGNYTIGSGGGVYVDKGTFNLQGGSVTGNSTSSSGIGGGVYVANKSTFSMTGGSVTSNAGGSSSGGVYVSSGCTFNLSGNPVIRGNSLRSSTVCNVGLNGNAFITLTGALTDGADIHVYKTGMVAQGDGSYIPTATDAAKFTCDQTGYAPRLNGSNQVELAQYFAVTLNATTKGTLTAAVGETAVSSGDNVFVGDEITLTLTPNEGYCVNTVSYNDGTDHEITPTGDVYSFAMPASDVTVSATFAPDIATHWQASATRDGSSAEKAYIITTTTGLNLLASEVNSGNNQSGKFFELGGDITYAHGTSWNDATSTENNYTAIGIYNDGNRYFEGTFDGKNYTVSGIRIYKSGTTNADGCQGLFGQVGFGGDVKNITLTDARITGKQYVGGIAGYCNRTIENCHVTSTVAIHAVVNYAYWHGGIVGSLSTGGSIIGCTSEATITKADGLANCTEYGGIAGDGDGNILHCLAIGANVSGSSNVGAIAGCIHDGYQTTNNYYTSCTVNGNAINVGTNTGDADGFREARTITLNDGISISAEVKNYPAAGLTAYTAPDGTNEYNEIVHGIGYALSYNNGITTTIYSGAGTTITLSHGEAPTGYTFDAYTVKDADNGDVIVTETSGVYTFEMPSKDVTVTATWKKLLTNTDISITIPIQEYTSSALTPVITVEDGSTPLIENTDYTVTLPEGRINAGNYTVTLTGIGNYDGKANETFTITPVPVTLTANSRNTDTYDGTQKFVTGFTSSVDNLTFTGVSASASGTNAGDYDVTFSGVTVNTTTDTSGNYVITGTTNGKLTINPASVTLTANSRNTDTYDGTQKTVTGFTSSVNGLSFAETVTASGSGTNAGDYDVTFSGVTVNTTKDNTGNYVVTGTTNGTLTINPASVTLTANSDTKEYSGAEQSVTGYTCSVNGLTFAGVTASGSGTNVGTYDVTFSGVTVNTTKDNTGNYVVTNTTNGTLTIEAAVTDYGALEVSEDENGTTATIDGSATGTISITSDVTVDNVSLSRTFTASEAATLMLPFDIDVANASGAAFYTYTGVTFNTTTNKWEATMTQISSGTIEANTPYVVMPSGAAITFTGSVTLNTTGGGGQQTTSGEWTFKGTYEEKTWTAAECGNDYGFAAADGISTDGHTAVKAGDFVKLAAGAHIKPGRSYLTYTGTGNPWASTNAPKHRTGADLPQSISVVLVNSDGSTTEIGASLVNSEERIVNSGAWFTLDGRKLDKQPTTKGVYIHEGKKHVIR